MRRCRRPSETRGEPDGSPRASTIPFLVAFGPRRVSTLHEPIQTLAFANHPIPLTRDALEGGGVVLEGVRAGAQVLDLGANRFELAGLLLALPFQAPDLEEAVLSAEEREVRGGCDDGGEEEVATFHSALRPGYSAVSASSSAMRRSWLYLATRSVRLALPVLICPARVATARSAMNVSAVSPERWLMM